ncbi:MAG: hypothetical protein J0I07_40985 [Myxococcales bacterium]|nr:hypothetical protein [Myxococcales bacterium]
MAAKSDKLIEEALALPTEERTKLVARLAASLVPFERPHVSLLSLAGRGTGIWDDDSTGHLDRLRDEWR